MKTGSEFHVGIVGLGSMGMGAALSCVRAGLSTWGADLNSNACATLKEAGACGVSDNAATFAEKLDALLVLVVNATQVKQVLFGEKGVAQHLKPGTAVMVSSTIASADAQEIATALAGFGLEMLDAPVSGGAVKAANGEMTVMASGSDIAFERLAPVLEAVAGKVYRIGSEPGLGSTVKIIHQLLAGVHIAAGAEAMALAARAGIPLVTGGSGLAIGLARQWAQENGNQAREAGRPLAGRSVVLSGSCSQMTNRQVAHYRQIAPAREVDVARCLSTETLAAYAHELAEWVLGQESVLAPLVFATASTDALAAIQQQYGAQKASQAVETLFSQLAARLAAEGVTRFIVAGGETSGVVTQSLGIKGFHIGPTISPGVPWVNALDKPVSLALKSGNFGDEAFFSRAQREFLS